MDKELFIEKMSSGLDKIEINYNNEQINKLWIYMNFLIEENKKYNLTGIDEPAEIISKHFLDSLMIFKEVELKSREKLLDVGTGAGFPGMVLKIMVPEIELVLLDSLLKRINFLKLLAVKLDLNNSLEIIHGRAEKLAHDKYYRQSFDIVVSRAVASINILSEYTLPFAKKGGNVIFYKGPDYEDELENGEKSISILGGEIKNIKKLNVPDLTGERYIVTIEKINNTPDSYPRRPGIPKKRPL